MKKVLVLVIAVMLCVIPLTAMADSGPLKLAAGVNADANKHNEEGIMHWGEGHHEVALKHFQAASKADHSLGETHYNEAIALDILPVVKEARGQPTAPSLFFYKFRTVGSIWGPALLNRQYGP
jgi:hypothetical protein